MNQTTFTLLIILIALKLAGVIGWSWWVVTAPLWLPWAMAAILLAGVALCGFGLLLALWVWTSLPERRVP